MPSPPWRLIIEDSPRSGAANMAVDESIAEAAASGDVPPTLRFYRWQSPTVSLGRFQKIADIDEARVAEQGYDLVRRATGGRAILHVDELTYSVAGPIAEPQMSGGVMDAYMRFSDALLSGLTSLGLSAENAGARARAGRDLSAACFEMPSAYEITAGGRKLMGSAQSRREGYVLQHGSLPLWGDVTRLVEVLSLTCDGKERLRQQLRRQAITLSEALKLPPDAEQPDFLSVAAAMADGFASELDQVLEAGALSADELRRSAELIRVRYADPAWTRQR
ncbi:MAG: lipoate--protein ligase family protein [Caldilineaceae bacterium SB0670_bin_27]|uniref:Lipoate--protein ligase family protein n=1 Tax=Caldilineaceae bacterium SB0664_bin_27 TaxID=2605260 RepID=A0A6B0YU27_9CHLR|nr:lipoate--protein ligase family protein [Caldilineaceae bacterium SB0664_bin_27]MYJ79379.1 lipoate--protein ligase family protein [Caldilineaceae bacterium SB0670_bin_27]